MAASYDVISRNISINISTINAYFSRYVDRYGAMFNDMEQLFLGNILITFIILHEMDHVEQNKKYNSSLNNTENNLIKMSFRTSYLLKNEEAFYRVLIEEGYKPEQIISLIKNQVDLKKKYYDKTPTERLANINAYNTLSAVLIPISEKVPRLCSYEYCNYMKSLLHGYEIVDNILINPTFTYVNGMGYQRDWQNFSFFDVDPQSMSDKLFSQHTLIERLSFGLPITYDEYDSVSKVLTKYDVFH